MTRVLIFDGEKAGKRFSMLCTALSMAGDGKGDRARETIRKEARLFDALDGVSDRQPTTTDQEARVLKPHDPPLTVTLAQDDFDLLSRYVDLTPWTPRSAREAVDVQDWLSASEKKE